MEMVIYWSPLEFPIFYLYVTIPHWTRWLKSINMPADDVLISWIILRIISWFSSSWSHHTLWILSPLVSVNYYSVCGTGQCQIVTVSWQFICWRKLIFAENLPLFCWHVLLNITEISSIFLWCKNVFYR